MINKHPKEKIKTKNKSGAGILFTDGKTILLLKRAHHESEPDTWCIPGGCSEEGEDPLQNAKRETQEECSLSKIPGELLENFENKDGNFLWTTFVFFVKTPFDVKISHEHTDWKWVEINNLSEYYLHPKFKLALPNFLNCIRQKIWLKIFDK